MPKGNGSLAETPMAIVLLLAATALDDGVLRNEFDVVEVNHFYTDAGELVFDQVIWWDWDGLYSKYTVQAWRILRGVRCPGKVRDGWTEPGKWIGGHAAPLFNRRTSLWVSRWYDEKCNRYREVTARFVRETHTQYDPEVHDRAWLPDNKRPGLTDFQRR